MANQFIKHTGLAAPLLLPNLDTDRIIPKQYLKSIRRSGFGVNLFDEMRYYDKGELYQTRARRPRPDFVLNQGRYNSATILLTGANFGCGSSREHAVWALADFGFRVIIAPSFADIFMTNCVKNGLLCVCLASVGRLARNCDQTPGYTLTVDLSTQTVQTADGAEESFAIDALSKTALLRGLDDIGMTLEKAEQIRAYEQQRMRTHPWLDQ